MEEHFRKVGITQFERMGFVPAGLGGIRAVLRALQWMARWFSDRPIPEELRNSQILCYVCVAPDRFHEDDTVWRSAP
jgi:hypothetical protein